MRKITKLATRVGNKGMVVKKEPNTPIKVEQKAIITLSQITQPSPLINILTRTSGRPLGFNRCRASIVNQTYKNIRHLVSFDSLADEEYVKASGAEYFFMDKAAIRGELDIADPKTGGAFIYNRYLNHLINKTESGWVLFLDDDDYLSDNFVIQKIVNCIKSNTDMILWQMKYPHGLVLPSLQELGKPPRMARIGAPCFMVHSGIAKTIKWDGWKCGDFRFIQKAWNKTVDKRVLKEVVVSLGGAGLGKRNDINAKPVNITSVNSGEINGKMIINLLNKGKVAEGLKTITPIQIENIDQKKIKLEIVSVGWNCENFINSTYNSLKNQVSGYYDYTIHFLDDGSTDNTYKLLQNIAAKDTNVKIYRNEKNYGAAYSRNKIIHQLTDDNAVILMIDLDDSITNTTYLDISNHYLSNENCLMTFGDFKFQSNGKVLSSEILSNSTIDNVLFEGSGFGCPPLRTFKVGPAKLVPENIFKDSQNQWYKYCTDVCLTAGVLAQCYGNQVYKINKTHYLYNDTRIESTQNKNKGKKHITTQEIFKKIVNSYKTGVIKKYKDVLMEAMPYIGIVMCTWKRISKLDETLKMLSKQTYKNFKFHIWNNNIQEKDQINKIIEKYSNLQIEVYHSSENIGGIGRFHYATKIADKYSKILFFDDDQIFNNEFIEDFDKLYKPKSVISWFGWKMNGSYYNRSRVIDLKECNYCGTGGMLVDSKIFLDKRILNIPKEFSFVEDLWLSYFAKYEHLYSLHGCNIDLKIIEDGNDQYKNLKPLKEKFYSYLENIYNGKRTFKSDLNKFFNRLENNIPFSINRFGDGEMMIIENLPIDLSKKHNGEHKYDPKDPKYGVLRNEMIEAIKYKNSNYFVGLPCPTCVGVDKSTKIYNYANQLDQNITWATLFGNANYDTFLTNITKSLKDKEIVLICNKNAKTNYFNALGCKIIKEFRVGANAWLENYSIIHEISEYSKNVNPNTVFLFMAGTLTKICIYKIHKTRQDLFLIDIGSSLDIKLSLGETRGFFKPTHKNRNKECQWMGKK